MGSFSVVLVLLSVVLGIANGFVVSPSASLNVRRQSETGGLQMLFGGGKKKAGGGIVVKVQQKTGFKETEVTLAGKTNLRKALMDNKIDIYPLQVCLRESLTLLFEAPCVRVRSCSSYTHRHIRGARRERRTTPGFSANDTNLR